MAKYKLELHAHTKDISKCASVSVEQLTELYTAAGYTGVVLTNHFEPYTFSFFNGTTWEEKVREYISGYEKLCDAAAGKLDIILGAEVRMTDYFNDYLLFGVTKEFLFKNPGIFEYGIKRLSAVCRDNGIMVYQAHPFRNGMTVVNPSYLDGVEIFNGHRNHDSRNEIAKAWAEKFGLRVSSGSDFHDPFSGIDAGIVTENRITTQRQLYEVLRNGEFELIQNTQEMQKRPGN